MESRHKLSLPTRRPPIALRSISAVDTYALRQAVLWPNKPLSYVRLPDDSDGQHFGAYVAITPSNQDDDDDDKVNDGINEKESKENEKRNPEELVSVISLFVDDESGAARFRKFATATLWQGRGVGSALLAHTIEMAARRGATSIWCDARQSALGFYQRFGMSGEGAVFLKGEVPYLRMCRALP